MWWSESDSSQHTVLVLEYTYSTSPKLDSWHVTCPPSSPETPSFPGLPYNTNPMLDQDNTCSGSGQNHWGLSLSLSLTSEPGSPGSPFSPFTPRFPGTPWRTKQTYTIMIKSQSKQTSFCFVDDISFQWDRLWLTRSPRQPFSPVSPGSPWSITTQISVKTPSER